MYSLDLKKKKKGNSSNSLFCTDLQFLKLILKMSFEKKVIIS